MATAIDQIVPVNIKVGAIIPSQVSFGVPMIAAQFATSKTTTAFTRTRVYTSLTDLVSDGWSTLDPVYLWAAALLSQNPSVQKFIVGRRDSADSDWAAALTAIQAENGGWYAFTAVPNGITTANIITEQLQIAAWAETAKRPFFTDSADSAILAAGTTDAASQIAAFARNYSIVSYHAPTAATVSATVTGGATQATSTIATASTGVVTLTFSAAFVASNVIAGTVNGQAYSVSYASSDTATFAALVAALQALSGTTVVAVNPSGAFGSRSILIGVVSGAIPSSGESVSAAWMGYLLPLPLGSWNPSYRQLAGTAPDTMTVGQKTVAWGKKCNTFTQVAGMNFTERGFVAGGAYLYFDVTFGIDWITTNVQTAVLQVLSADTKVPFSDGGGVLLKSIVKGVLNMAAANGILDASSIDVTVPKVADISSTDKGNRNFPNVNFKARLLGAVNTVQINGTVAF